MSIADTSMRLAAEGFVAEASAQIGNMVGATTFLVRHAWQFFTHADAYTSISSLFCAFNRSIG